MKHGVSKQFLLIAAGIIWLVAGANILRIGISTWQHGSQQIMLFKIAEASVVFLLFFVLIFRKLYYKHTKRIEEKSDKNCPFAFFDTKGWIIMAVMTSAGIAMRAFHLLPDSFISVFYTGLSLALIFTGVMFIRYWYKTRIVKEGKQQNSQ